MPAIWDPDPIDTTSKHLEIGGAAYRVCGRLSDPRASRIYVLVERCTTEPQRELAPHLMFGFTPAEARVAQLLAARKSNREIAAELAVTQHTARRHTEKVLLKLGIHRRTDVTSALERASRAHAFADSPRTTASTIR